MHEINSNKIACNEYPLDPYPLPYSLPYSTNTSTTSTAGQFTAKPPLGAYSPSHNLTTSSFPSSPLHSHTFQVSPWAHILQFGKATLTPA